MSVTSVSTNIIPNNGAEIIKDFKAGAKEVGKNLIGTATDVKNKVLDEKNVIGTATDTGKQIVEKTKEMKAKGLGIWNVLKKSGIMLGAALGAFAGLVAAGTITVTLPVSLPILGALAGGLFLGGSIAALIHNIKDPTVHGAGEIFKGTLKDIGINMLLAVPTLISYIMNPQQANEDIKSFSGTIKQMSKDLQKNAEDLKSILKNPDTHFKQETQEQLRNLQKYLQQYQTAVAKLSGNSTPKDIENLENLKNSISGIVKTLKVKQEILEDPEANKDRSCSKVLNSLDGTFSNEKLNETFQKLNDSFSKKSKGKEDKVVNISNIKSDIENNKRLGNDASSNNLNVSEKITDNTFQKFNDSFSKKLEETNQASDETLNLTNIDFEKEIVRGNLGQVDRITNNEMIKPLPSSVAENQNTKTLDNVLEQFKNVNLEQLEATVKRKAQSCYEKEGDRYNNILKDITILKVFKEAINDLKKNDRTIDTLNGIKNDALQAVKNLQQNKLQESDFNELCNAIEALTTDSNKNIQQYEMSVTLGKYKSWNYFGYDYERNINTSLKFNGSMIALALT